MGKLDNKVAVITGGSSGIGRATAVALAREGASVAVSGRKASALEEVALAIEDAGGRSLTQVMDVRDEAQMAELIDSAVAQFGGLDVMVNNAGLNWPGNIMNGTVDQWREMLETNVLALLIGCREAVRAMRASDGGHIVNISSNATRHMEASNQVYSATKHAVNAISDGLRNEVQGDAIRVTVVMPGATLTNFGRTLPQEVLNNAATALGLDPETEGVKHGEYLQQEGVDRVLKERPGVFLSSEDLANAVLYAVTQPPSVLIDEMLVRPSVGMPLGG